MKSISKMIRGRRYWAATYRWAIYFGTNKPWTDDRGREWLGRSRGIGISWRETFGKRPKLLRERGYRGFQLLGLHAYYQG